MAIIRKKSPVASADAEVQDSPVAELEAPENNREVESDTEQAAESVISKDTTEAILQK